MPVLYISIALIAVVAGTASGGGFDIMYHVLLPAGFVAMGCIRCLVWYRRRATRPDLAKMRSYLRTTTAIALGLGFVGGVWSIDAYYDTREIRRVLTPVFIFMITFAGAICLTSVPRAAIGVMATALLPMMGIMMTSDDIGVQAMAVCFTTVSLLIMALVVSSFREIISGLELRHELQKLSETDPLTGLANRRAFRVQFAALTASLAPSRCVSIVMIDLDGFKLANDRFGHAAGDAILVQAGERLLTLCPQAASIARLGGDEFALLIEADGNGEYCAALRDSVRMVLSLPYHYHDQQIPISASVGMASCSDTNASLEPLMRAADHDMYGAKQRATARLRG